MNVVRNAIWLAVLFFFIFIFSFIWLIVPRLTDAIYTNVNASNSSELLDRVYLDWLGFKTLIIQAFYVLCSLLVLFTFVNSMVDTQDFKGYVVSAFGGLIATPVVIYLVAQFWNTFSLLGITLGEVSTVFITSFPLILLANFVFGLLSFIFISRQNRA